MFFFLTLGVAANMAIAFSPQRQWHQPTHQFPLKTQNPYSYLSIKDEVPFSTFSFPFPKELRSTTSSAANDQATVETPVNGDRNGKFIENSFNDINERFSSSGSTDFAIGDESSESDGRSSSEKLSEIEQFMSDFRSLYKDLESGGGSVKRSMGGLKKINFTYVAPAPSDPAEYSKITKDNIQLHGYWRLQKPTVFDGDDEDVDWKRIHQQVTKDRMHARATPSDIPPPLLVYLPGLDGFGISATAQFDDLASSFELWRMNLDKNDSTTSFGDLVSAVVQFVKEATSATVDVVNDGSESGSVPREVVIVGESFGGLLACAVSMALTNVKQSYFKVKGMTLVNPATSFDETNWEQLVPLMTSLRYLESQEEIIDDSGNFRLNSSGRLPTPYSVLGGLALSATIPDSDQYSRILNFILRNISSNVVSNEQILSATSDGFRILAENLPALTLEHRVTKWLPVGTSVVNNENRLSKLHVPTLIIGGNDDNMLPTKEEANRLGKLLPDCVKMDISGSGHFVLDTRVNLTEVLIDSHIDPLDIQKNSKPYDPITDWELPPKHVREAVIEKRVKPLRERASPVFYSTDSVTGTRRKGLSHLPSADGPLLIVGNHQLFGLDLGMIISQLLEERGIVARGLAHPLVSGGASMGSGQDALRTQKRRWEFNEDSPFEVDLFTMFGAVTVNPRNFYRLLQTNQTVLLFPGGVREALHGKNEDYMLFWPEKTDFVRVAARLNATIVPLSAIGAADSAEILIDPPDMLKLPFGIGENLKNSTSSTKSARYDADNEDELFVPPLAVPKPFTARHYFLFGKAYDTSLVDSKDKNACQRLYEDVESEVKDGIDALLRARKDDPYALDGIKRSAYQSLLGKDPPTFPLESLSPSKRRN